MTGNSQRPRSLNPGIVLPYGHDTITVHVPADKLIGVFLPRSLPPLPDPASAVRQALVEPVAGPPLRELGARAPRVAIAIEDTTRPVPNALLIDALMTELLLAGVTPAQVTAVVATGLHRPLTEQEMAAALGRWHGNVSCENHDAHDPNRLARLGRTSLGTEISLNRSFLEADLKITTGDVEYHQFCGYGGGVKCVYPGLADAAAIRANHARMDLPGTGPGSIDGNPVRQEVDEVGRMARVDFNVSLAMDAEHRIVAVRAGSPDVSFRQACAFVDRMYDIPVPQRAELIIAAPGGYPKDINLYQSQKAIEEATQVVQPGGRVLLVARCEEGSGSERFEQWMEAAYCPDDIVRRIRQDFVMGGHKAYQIAREIQRAEIHMYSEIPPGRVRSWLMTPVRSIAEIGQRIAHARSVMVLPQATLIRARVASLPGSKP
jgi:nickel-dependent lactate racemase